MKKLLVGYVSVIVIIAYMVTYVIKIKEKRTDEYVRNRVIQLKGNERACSGVQVKAKSGKVYILSAAHCAALATNDRMEASIEGGPISTVKIIDIDREHDLLLLSSVNSNSIDVAASIKPHEHIHTITHGGHFPAYRTDGELLEERTFRIMGPEINSDEDLKNCPITSYSEPVFGEMGYFCALTMTMHISTAFVIPGSSGGPALDNEGKLIGIVSCSTDMFSGLVPLHNIQSFLKGR